MKKSNVCTVIPVMSTPTHQQQFLDAAKYGHLDVIKLLLTDSRVDPSDDDNAAIQQAARNGHMEIVNIKNTII